MPKLPRQRRMIVEALEPRLMFSATADIAVFHDSSSDIDLAYAAQATDLSLVYDLPDNPILIAMATEDGSDIPEHPATSSAAANVSNLPASNLPASNLIAIDPSAAGVDVPDSPGLTTTAVTPIIDVSDTVLVAMAKSEADTAAALALTTTAATQGPVFVFVDTTVDQYQALVKDIEDNSSSQNITIVYLDPNQSGVQQITDALADQTQIAAIHLITHGSAGSFQLGNIAINQNTLDIYADNIAAWQTALQESADILLYGCDVAATTAGQQLIAQIGELTRADVAASVDLTGNSSLGGDWDLEFHYGNIETNLLISAEAREDWNLILANTNYIYVASSNSTQVFKDTDNVGQEFLYNNGGTYVVNQIAVQLKTLAGAAAQTITVTLRNTWDGAILRSDTISSTDLTTNFEWYAFDFANYTLNTGQNYIVQIYSSGTDSKVAAAYHSSNQWNQSEFIFDGTHNSSADLTFLIAYDDGSNQTPSHAAISDQAATEHSAFSYTVSAFSDSDIGDRLTYSATLSNGAALPSWLSFNASTRTFSGTPGSNDAGTIAVKVLASDGTATGSVTFNIVTANNNTAPTVANIIPNQGATEDSAFSYQFPANTFNDVNADPLSYSATLSNGSALPAWLSFDATTRTFSGTPTNGDVGTIAVKVTANDGQGGTIDDTFDIVVANTNDAPTVANLIPDRAATEDSAFSFQFAANTFADVDASTTLTYSATLSGGGALPAWLSFNAATRTFSGTPANGDVGTISVRVTASDGSGGTVNDTFDIVVANTNDAPTVANAIGDQAATEDSAFSFQFPANTFNDVDVGNTLTYSAVLSGGGALPSWLTFNAATRTFSGTPLNADVGTISIQVTANDSQGGTVSDTFDIVIANTNDAPTVANAIPDRAATEDSAFSYQFPANTFADVDASTTLTYSATLSGGGALPAWLSFNAATRTFSGTPANGDVGTVSVRVTADDGSGGTVNDTFDIVVANTNDAPTVANTIADRAATEDTAFSFQFASNTFSDVDVGDTLTYTATVGGGALPAWLSFNAATRTFSGTPANGDVGTISVQVTADDGNGSIISDTFDIVIANVNDAPVVANTIPNRSATEDSAFSYQFPANTFGDVDAGDTLTYTAQLSGGGALPAWLSFNAGTRTFSGTPLNGDVGTVAVEVIADDGNGGTVTDTFDIVVANSNDAPTVANVIPDQAGTQGTPFSFQFLSNSFNDVDVGDTLTYTATVGGGALPSWLTFNAATRTFSGTPGSTDVGTISVQVTAADGNGGTINDTFDIVIANVNDAPVVANSIPDRSVVKLNPFNYQFPANTFNDVDGDTLTYTAQLSGGGALPAWLSFNAATRTFSGTPQPGDVGTVAIEVIADDGSLTISDTFNITVTNTNFAPTVANTIPDQAATEDAAFNFQFAPNTFDDVDGDPLIYTATLAGGAPLPSWLTFNAATRTFSGTPLNANVGTISIEVTADDGDLTIADTFDIVISNTNDAPVIANAIPNQNATEDAAFNFQFAGNTFNDVDGDTLTYSAQLAGGGALPAWLSFDPVTRTFSGTPLNADVGTLSLDVIADDGNGGTVTDTFNIVIANSNDAPTVANAIPNQNATEDSAFNFQFVANTFNDIDSGDTLTYSAQLAGGGALPTWLSFNAATRTFSGTPLNADVGTVSLDIIADDGNGGTVTDTFNIVIANSNDAPVIANAIPNQNAIEDAAFNFQFAGNTFNDVDGDTLTYSAQLAGGGALPAWLSFDPVTRTFSGTPLNANVGTLSLDVIADDGNGGTVTDTFNIVVANTNDAPVVANAIPNQSATEDSAFNFQFVANTFNDIDSGDTLTYSAQLAGGGALPAWLSFDPATRTFSGTPLNANVGTLSLDVIADDGNGGTVTDTFNIVIANSNDAPVIANAIPNQNATEDAAFNFQFAGNTFDDVDVGDTLSYSAQLAGGGALPAWLSFDPVTRTFSGTPLNADVGTLSLDVIADDGNGGTVTDTFDIVIANTNDVPVVANAIPDQNATEDSAFNFQFASNTFNDVDVSNTLTYTATLAGGGALPAWLSFNAATRTFSGTPLNADVGTISIEVIANDSQGGTIADTFALAIANTNDAPVVANTIPDQVAVEDSAFNFQFASNAFADEDISDSLSYSATLAGGAALPAWLSFNAATRTFSGTPANADVGTLSIQVSANDGNGGSIADSFDIVISNTNDAPVVANSIADQIFTEDVAFNFQIPANTFNDDDTGDTLTYTATLVGGGMLPSYMSFDAATRTFSGTPSNLDVGSFSVRVVANDGHGGIISDTFAVTIVNSNDAPTLANNIPDQSATQGSAFNFQFAANTFDDEDVGTVFSYSAQIAGGGALPTWLTFDAATRTFSGTPLNNDVGTLTLEVIADDGQGASVSDSFAIVIANINDAPVVANPLVDQTAQEDAVFNFQIPANTFLDVDAGATLTYSATLAGGGALPTWLSFDASTRTFSGTPTNDDLGSVNVLVTVDDGLGSSVSDSFTIAVLNSNDAPTLANAIPNQFIDEDTAFSFQFASNTFSDVDAGNILSYTAQLANGTPLPSWLSFDPVTRTFSGTPLNADVGSLSIQVTADDGHGGTVNTSFDVVVANTADAPTLVNPIDNIVIEVNRPLNFVVPNNTFHDDDLGDSLSYSVQLIDGGNLPAWLSFDPVTRTFSGVPTTEHVGSRITIELTATDGTGNTSNTAFVIFVDEKSSIYTPETPIKIIEKPALPETPAIAPPEVIPVNTQQPNGEDPTAAVVNDGPQRLLIDDNRLPLLLSLNEEVPEVDRNNIRLMDIRASLSAATSSPLLASLIAPDAGFSITEVEDFNSALRRVHDEMNEVMDAEEMQKSILSGITFSVTTGLIIWSLRASSLLLTLMSMMPLWSGMDPLPILDQVNKRKEELKQQRKDKQKEDENAKEVGYLFDQAQSSHSEKGKSVK